MIKLLTATDSIEANLVLNLLTQVEIEARIDGEYLQGGVGELQSFGSIRVMVKEDDYPRAKEVLKDYFDAPLAEEEAYNNGQLQS